MDGQSYCSLRPAPPVVCGLPTTAPGRAGIRPEKNRSVFSVAIILDILSRLGFMIPLHLALAKWCGEVTADDVFYYFIILNQNNGLLTSTPRLFFVSFYVANRACTLSITITISRAMLISLRGQGAVRVELATTTLCGRSGEGSLPSFIGEISLKTA